MGGGAYGGEGTQKEIALIWCDSECKHALHADMMPAYSPIVVLCPKRDDTDTFDHRRECSLRSKYNIFVYFRRQPHAASGHENLRQGFKTVGSPVHLMRSANMEKFPNISDVVEVLPLQVHLSRTLQQLYLQPPHLLALQSCVYLKDETEVLGAAMLAAIAVQEATENREFLSWTRAAMTTRGTNNDGVVT